MSLKYEIPAKLRNEWNGSEIELRNEKENKGNNPPVREILSLVPN